MKTCPICNRSLKPLLVRSGFMNSEYFCLVCGKSYKMTEQEYFIELQNQQRGLQHVNRSGRTKSW
jgi:transcription elongation factor Elf1